jgi:hypothetical protein
MLCRRKLPKPEAPDFYLFRLAAARLGSIDFHSATWCSPDIQVISISEGKIHSRVEQEALVLMPKYSWIRSAVGTFYAEPTDQFWSARLQLVNCEKENVPVSEKNRRGVCAI